MRRSTLAAAALVPACALALTACGSKSANSLSAGATTTSTVALQNNAHLTQAQLVARLKTAMGTVTALHMKGSMTDSGSTTVMDIQVNKDGSGQGTMTVAGMTIPMISIGSTTYTQITASYANMIKSGMGSAASSTIGAQFTSEMTVGKWIKYTGDSSADSALGSFSNFSDMTSQLTDNSDTFTYLGTSTLNGQPVAQYKDVSKDGSSPAATMSILLTGSPLPIKEDAGSQGSVTFTWNQPTKVTAPPAADVVTMPSALLGDGSTASPMASAS